MNIKKIYFLICFPGIVLGFAKQQKSIFYTNENNFICAVLFSSIIVISSLIRNHASKKKAIYRKIKKDIYEKFKKNICRKIKKNIYEKTNYESLSTELSQFLIRAVVNKAKESVANFKGVPLIRDEDSSVFKNIAILLGIKKVISTIGWQRFYIKHILDANLSDEELSKRKFYNNSFLTQLFTKYKTDLLIFNQGDILSSNIKNFLWTTNLVLLENEKKYKDVLELIKKTLLPEKNKNLLIFKNIINKFKKSDKDIVLKVLV